jgi:hypothetical protein
MAAAARNLGLIMRKLFGIGKPRCLQGLGGSLDALWALLQRLLDRSESPPHGPSRNQFADRYFRSRSYPIYLPAAKS